jgi:hypothetical protein
MVWIATLVVIIAAISLRRSHAAGDQKRDTV